MKRDVNNISFFFVYLHLNGKKYNENILIKMKFLSKKVG
jgi:hypothetical protein